MHCAHVAFWHLADNPTAPANVRYWGNSGHWSARTLNGSVAIDPIRTLGDGASPSFSTLNATKKARSILDLGRNLANEERYHSHNREGDADYHA